MRMPEIEEPVTRGRVSIDRGQSEERVPVSSLYVHVFISV
jgi:concentrative nucleoside transporter, CNT family